jgi:hypothetical protein
MARASKSKFKLTKEQLYVLAANGRPFDEVTLQMLERVLVDGEQQHLVAKEFGKSQQFINGRVQAIYRRLADQMANLPSGFVVRTVAVHPDDLEKLNQLEQKSYERALS